jgi:WD40 repeat protein
MASKEGKITWKLSEAAFTFDCHPKERLIVSGTISGKVLLNMYSLDHSDEVGVDMPVAKLYKHKGSCRALKFSTKGNVVFSGSSDCSLVAMDLEAGEVIHSVKDAHSSPLFSMHVLSEKLVATGDDTGCIKLWDIRTFQCVMNLQENDDYISDFADSLQKNTLLATSGDGRLVAIDLRKKGLEEKSDQMESELLCVEVIKVYD